MKFLVKITFAFLALSLISCSSSKNKTRSSTSSKQRTSNTRAIPKKERIARANKYNYKNLPVMSSNLNIRYNISKQAIKDTFNTLIDEYMITDMKVQAMDLDVELEKVKPANLEFSERAVLITLPLKILITKKTFIKDFTADGEIELNFISNLDLDRDWNLSSITNLETYDWIAKPNLDVGFVKIPIENLANSIIEKSKANLEKQIDKTVKEQFILRNRILSTLKYIEQPLKIDTIVDAWMQINPKEVNLDGILNTEDWATGIIQIEGNAKLNSEEPKEKIAGVQLPDFAWKNELSETSKLSVFLDITYKSLNKTLRQKFKGKRFSDGDKEVLIKEIKLSKYNDKIEVVADVEGTFTGEILVRGIPKFDPETKTFYADDIDLKIKANNVIQKAAAWMLKGKIKSRLVKMAHFSIADNLNSLKALIKKQISTFNQEDKFNIDLEFEDLTIDKFLLDEDRVHTLVNIYMSIVVEVSDFQSFRSLNPTIFLKN